MNKCRILGLTVLPLNRGSICVLLSRNLIECCAHCAACCMHAQHLCIIKIIPVSPCIGSEGWLDRCQQFKWQVDRASVYIIVALTKCQYPPGSNY